MWFSSKLCLHPQWQAAVGAERRVAMTKQTVFWEPNRASSGGVGSLFHLQSPELQAVHWCGWSLVSVVFTLFFFFSHPSKNKLRLERDSENCCICCFSLRLFKKKKKQGNLLPCFFFSFFNDKNDYDWNCLFLLFWNCGVWVEAEGRTL